MKNVSGFLYTFVVIFATAIVFLFDFGAPLAIMLIGQQMGLWQFSWGGVLALYVLHESFVEVKHGVSVMVQSEDGDEDGD